MKHADACGGFTEDEGGVPKQEVIVCFSVSLFVMFD